MHNDVGFWRTGLLLVTFGPVCLDSSGGQLLTAQIAGGCAII
jgi:hypothetical protein